MNRINIKREVLEFSEMREDPCASYEVFIDEISLNSIHGEEFVSPLGGYSRDGFMKHLNEFRGCAGAVQPGRFWVGVCPVDNDLWCSSLTARIEVSEEVIKWSDFCDTGYDHVELQWVNSPLESMRSAEFIFSRDQYFAALDQALTDYIAEGTWILPDRKPWYRWR